MVLLVFPVKCKTMTETNIRISKVLCVGCSVVWPPVNVYMVFRVADNLCSLSSKAIWALFCRAHTLCNWLLVLCDIKEIPLAVALGAKFPGITPASWTHLPRAEAYPAIELSHWWLCVLVCHHWWHWAGALSSTVIQKFWKADLAKGY